MRVHNGESRIPALELYTTMLKVLSPCGTPSTVGSIIYVPARSETCAVAAPERASENAPEDASGALPIPRNIATFTNTGAWGCKRILWSDFQMDVVG